MYITDIHNDYVTIREWFFKTKTTLFNNKNIFYMRTHTHTYIYIERERLNN